MTDIERLTQAISGLINARIAYYQSSELDWQAYEWRRRDDEKSVEHAEHELSEVLADVFQVRNPRKEGT